MDSEKKGMVWIKKNLFWIAAVCGALAFLGWAMPMFSSKPITAELVDGAYNLTKGSRESIYVGSVLFMENGSACLWAFAIIYGLVLLGVVFSLLGKANKHFYEAGMVMFLMGAILLLTGNVFYDYSKCMSVIGSSFMDYLEDWRSLAGSRCSAGVIWGICFSFIASLIDFSAAYEERKFSLRDLLEIAILSALGIVIDVIQHFIPSIGVTGGSIGIATLPLLYVALRHGPLAGFISGGIIYGLITCITDGYGIFLYPFDYMVGFGSVAILGFFKPLIFGEKNVGYNLKGEIFIFVGCLLSGLVRFVGSSLSSIVNYGLNLIGAMAYNVIYVFASAGISAVILMALYGPLLRLQKAFPPSEAK